MEQLFRLRPDYLGYMHSRPAMTLVHSIYGTVLQTKSIFLVFDSMDKILERYQRCSLSEGGVIEDYSELEGSTNSDHILLRSQVEALRKSERNLMGEQLGSLTQRGVQQLEQQIGDALRSIRLRRDFLLANSIRELRNKERLLMEQNKILQRKKAELLQASMHKNCTSAFCNAAAASLPNLNISNRLNSIEDGNSDNEPAGSVMASVD
ncbi:MADS-box transcription factor 20-like isoform X2 [Brachypodium distachyon]|uniref:MADS-box transcription factor 20-like isoform X2 n=1 Tax=Brachypodium distachyon TaxID=15368 RepID=UPI000D0DAEF5|nr:MADS-box transcription factor 20-like isoform X2 [Brachypodium distachyon]|eukprot:XP_024318438.1 MADS-box transcription factor 20-like isoform X2 [Brachypodium distachyon]